MAMLPASFLTAPSRNYSPYPSHSKGWDDYTPHRPRPSSKHAAGWRIGAGLPSPSPPARNGHPRRGHGAHRSLPSSKSVWGLQVPCSPRERGGGAPDPSHRSHSREWDDYSPHQSLPPSNSVCARRTAAPILHPAGRGLPDLLPIASSYRAHRPAAPWGGRGQALGPFPAFGRGS